MVRFRARQRRLCLMRQDAHWYCISKGRFPERNGFCYRTTLCTSTTVHDDHAVSIPHLTHRNRLDGPFPRRSPHIRPLSHPPPGEPDIDTARQHFLLQQHGPLLHQHEPPHPPETPLHRLRRRDPPTTLEPHHRRFPHGRSRRSVQTPCRQDVR